MNWLGLTFVSAVSHSSARILQKKLVTGSERDPFTFSFLFQFLVACLFLVYTLASGTLERPDISGLAPNFIAMGVFFGLGNIFVFKAFKIAQASEVEIIYTSNTVWAVLSAFFVLGERISSLNIVGIFLVLSGVMVIQYQRTSWKVNKGHLYALFGSMMFGLGFTNDAYIISRYTSIPSYLVLSFGVPAIVTLLFKPKLVFGLKHYFSKAKTVFILSLCIAFYTLFALYLWAAYKSGGPLSIISPVLQARIILTVIFAYIFLKERDNLPKKITGMALAIVGVFFLI